MLPRTAPQAPFDPGRRPGCLVVGASKRRQLVELALEYALEVDAVGVVHNAVKHGIGGGGMPPAVVDSLSGHSTLVGAAQDVLVAGIELPTILQAGRWKSPAMANRYGERLLARKSAAAHLTRIQPRGS